MWVEVERLWWVTEGYERPVGQEREYGPPRLLRGALEGPPFFLGALCEEPVGLSALPAGVGWWPGGVEDLPRAGAVVGDAVLNEAPRGSIVGCSAATLGVRWARRARVRRDWSESGDAGLGVSVLEELEFGSSERRCELGERCGEWGEKGAVVRLKLGVGQEGLERLRGDLLGEWLGSRGSRRME